jgi:hypothetical protein
MNSEGQTRAMQQQRRQRIDQTRDHLRFLDDRINQLLDMGADQLGKILKEGEAALKAVRPSDPETLFDIDIGGTRIGISIDGYRERAKATWVGAAVGGWDAVTLGMHLSDEDRADAARAYGVDPNSGYFMAGQITAGLTVGVAMGVASGGLGATTHVGRAAAMARAIGTGMKGLMLGSDAYHAGTALGSYAATGDWGAEQNMATANAAAHLFGLRLGQAYRPQCFIEGTPVLAMGAGGTAIAKAIEEIEVGDRVWSRNERTGEEGFKPVTRLYRNEADTLVHLSYTTKETGAESASDRWSFNDGSASAATSTHTITGTPEHPFWSLTRQGWVNMGELPVGEWLRLEEGGAMVTTTRTDHCSKLVAT